MKIIKPNLIKICSICVVCLLFFSFTPVENDKAKTYYYAFDKKVKVEQIGDKIIVKKKKTQKKTKCEESVKEILGEVEIEWIDADVNRIDLKNVKNKEKKIRKLLLDNEVLSVRNIYQTDEKLELGFSNEIILKFKDKVDNTTREELLESYRLKKSKSTKIYQLVTISKDEDIVKISNELYETGYFLYAYPNILCKAEIFSTFPNDPYFQFQITCHNTGQIFNGHSGTNDADIDAPEAWDITTGSNDIVVAVFDQGITSDHPDLPNTRQVRLDGSNFGLGDENDPSPVGNSNHGNACAGVIGASMNNNQGIAGIAPNCRIMPIRWDETTTSSEMVDGIQFAVDNGANIISNSWGYRSPNRYLIPALVDAIYYAICENVVVIFAAGNNARHNICGDDGFVQFPANADIDGLLTVGASDRYDSQSDYSPTSWLIDIVAPSHRAYPPEAYSSGCGGISGETLEMWTLDKPGTTGYNPWPSTNMHPPVTLETLPDNLSYTGRFGGTSHACPVVAGVAALVLSKNPELTPIEVYDILTGSADKIGGYSYSDGQCREAGYGRVNALSALCVKNCYLIDYKNKTVNTNTTIEGCSLELNDVEVLNNSKLIINARNEVIVNSEFEVALGAEFEVK